MLASLGRPLRGFAGSTSRRGVLIGTLALFALLAIPAFAQAAGTITVTKGGYRDSSTNSASTYALGLSGAAFEYAAYASATDPRTLTDAAINGLTWLPLCSPTSAAGTCTSGSLSNGRYLVREKTAPAGWSVIQSAAWSGGSSGSSPVRQYIADVTVSNNNPTAEPVPAGLGGSVGGDSSPASGIFVNRRDNRAFPNTCGLKVLLLLDKSGSIGDTAGEATGYANAAKGFVDALAGTPTSLKIASFNTSASFVGAGTGTEYSLNAAGDRTTAKGQIDSIYAGVTGGTNWDAGMRLAATAGVDVVIFITDGNPTAYGDASGFSGQSGRVDLLDLTYGIAASNIAKTGGVTSAAAALTQKVLAVGVGSGITEDNLKAVSGPNKFVSASDTNPDYAAVTDVTQLGSALKAIANRLCGSRIHVRKLTDGDANPSQARSGWTFTATGGTSPVSFTPASIVTDGTVASDVIAVDQIPAAGSASAVTVAETAKAGYSIAASQCAKGADGSAFPAPADGVGTATQSIAQIKQNEDWWCTFRNKKDATVTVTKDAVPDDAQDFAFTTSGLGAGFSLDDDANATLASSRTITVSGSGLGFGSKSVTETATAGWSLTGLTCTKNGVSAGTINAAAATIDVQPGDAWACAFVNTKDATVQIVKDAQPNDAQDFAFTSSGLGSGFSLDDDADAALSNTKTITVTGTGLGFGAKSVTETATAGWSLTGLTCTRNGVSAGTINAATATLDVQAGDAWICTYTNKQDANVTVTKDAIPNAAQDFAFTSTGLGAGFSLDDDADATLSSTKAITVTAGGLGYGSKTLTETATPGWSLTSISCQNGTQPAQSNATIDVQPGDAWVCTFTNKKDATVTVTKDAQPNSAQDFAFTTTGGGLSSFSLDDDADPALSTTKTFTVAAAQFGTKSVAESAQAGWSLTELTCTKNGGAAGTVNGATATLDVQAGDAWVCAYTNKQDATVQIIKDAVPNDAQNFAFSTTGSGLTGFSLDDDADSTLPNTTTMTFPASDFGTKTVSETQISGWDLGTLACADAQGAPAATVAFGVVTGGVFSAGAADADFGAGDTAVQVDAQAGTHVVCTFTNNKVGLDVAKLAVNATVNAGDEIGYTITTKNTGEGTAKGVVMTDPLPAGVEWTIKSQTNAGECSISPSGVSSGQVVTCAYGDLAGGAVRTLEIEATTTGAACATYDNTATATATNAPSDADSAVIRCLKPSISITKTAAASVIDAGHTATFTIAVANAGPGVAYAVKVKDPLPAGLTWTDDSADCAIAADQGNGDIPTLSCDFGDLAPDASRSVSLTAQTSFAACATYANTATVSGGNFATEQASDTITCRSADLTVVKSPDSQVVDAGDPVSFQMVTSNSGAGTAKSVTLSDPLPAGVTWTVSGPSDECEITGAVGSQMLACDYGDLGPDATRTVTVTAQTSFAACAIYDNTATVDADNTPADSDSGKITCRKPTLDITKLAVETTVSAGDKLGFTITTSNTGEGTARDVTMSDPLPAGVTWSIASQDDTSAPLECAISGPVGTQVLDCSYGDLPAGVVRTVKVEAQTDADNCATYDNTATAAADNAPGDSDRAVIDCLKPNVTITKTAAASPINAGEDASFTITVRNQGSSQTTGAATAVKLSDPLTSTLTWTLGGADAPSCDITGTQLDCDFGDVAPGAVRVVTLTAPTTRDECGVYENTATVDGSNFAARTASGTVVCQKPKLTVEKVASTTTVDPGDPIEFTITSANTGGEGVGVAKSVTLSDPLPAGVTWSLASQDDESAPLECKVTGDAGSQSLDCTYGDLNPGASRTVKLTAATSFEQCGVYDNMATLTATNAPGVQDDATITCRPPATVRVKKVVTGQTEDTTKFAFTSTLIPNAENRAADFQLSQADGTTAFTVRADGTTYSITELEPYGAGYKLVSASCVQDELQAESRSKNTTTDAQRTTTVKPVSGASYTCTFVNAKLASSLLVLKGPKTQSVYLDGSASYTYDVSNPGTSDLTDVTLTDDRCSAISAPDKSTAVDSGNNGDDLLETGETWRYTCTVKAADLFRSSSDPVTNTATATGKDQTGSTLTARDTALTNLLVPGIAIDKTGPATATAGELLTYNLAVTNTGNTSFPEGGVKLTDTVLSGGACATAPTVPISKNGDKTPGELNPGETWVYQCQVQTKTGETKVTNKGDVSGTDGGGKTVTATDTAETVLGAPAAGVSPAGKVSGRARLTGTVGCAASRYAKASVTGTNIKQVTFYVNGRKVKTLTKANSGKNFQVRFLTKSLKYGTYKVRVAVRFKANAVPQSRTLNLQFNRCRPRVIKPTFTG